MFSLKSHNISCTHCEKCNIHTWQKFIAKQVLKYLLSSAVWYWERLTLPQISEVTHVCDTGSGRDSTHPGPGRCAPAKQCAPLQKSLTLSGMSLFPQQWLGSQTHLACSGDLNPIILNWIRQWSGWQLEEWCFCWIDQTQQQDSSHSASPHFYQCWLSCSFFSRVP